MTNLRISLAQINTSVGDISGNVDKIQFYLQEARKLESDIVAFPELAITGYPPEDLLHRSQFLKSNIVAMQQIVKESKVGSLKAISPSASGWAKVYGYNTIIIDKIRVAS